MCQLYSLFQKNQRIKTTPTLLLRAVGYSLNWEMQAKNAIKQNIKINFRLVYKSGFSGISKSKKITRIDVPPTSGGFYVNWNFFRCRATPDDGTKIKSHVHCCIGVCPCVNTPGSDFHPLRDRIDVARTGKYYSFLAANTSTRAHNIITCTHFDSNVKFLVRNPK